MNSPSRFGRRAAAVALAAALAACGGGGDGSSTSSDNTDNTPRPSPGGQTLACSLRYSLTNLPAQGSGTDPLLAQQWHLQPGGTNALAAWAAGNKADGVRVAVVDDGVETVHEDLWPNVAPGASYNYLDGSDAPLPCTSDDSHGTSVAGIVAARDGNALGGAGVAPRAALAGYNALVSGTDADIADAQVHSVQATAVLNNSWGSPDDGLLHPAFAAWEQAILDGLRIGRNGLGTVYVSAAGNGGVISLILANGATTTASGVDNSNFDGYVNKLGINAACAVDQGGKPLSYSEPGANLLVCGPGGRDITTTTIRNAYRSNFSGTSAAAPMVSGVAALVLKARSDLTWRDVRLILAQSARENDPGSASWLPSALPGKRFSHQYGFGTVDAKAAIDLAARWQSVGGSSTLKQCGPYSSAPNRPIPGAGGTLSSPVPGAPASDTITVPPAGQQCAIGRIEFVEVSFTSDHAYAGDLAITLSSPAGQSSVLAPTQACGANADPASNPCAKVYSDWRFGSVRHLDEPAAGGWRLDVVDGLPRNTGTLQRWSITLWGR